MRVSCAAIPSTTAASFPSYLRPMGAKVPRIYGPSGDEPM
jgi:hypothetical protein